MPTIPILPGDSSATVEYKVYLAQQSTALATEYGYLRKWRGYYSGSHDLLLSDDQRAFLEGVIDKDNIDWPIDNKCRKVVDKVRARLNVTGWQDASGTEAALDEVKPNDMSALARAVFWWTENDMDRWEGELYKAALRDSEAYIIVDHNGTRPRFTFAQRWDGLEQSTGIRMVYEDEAKTTPIYAIKRWTVSDPANPNAGGAQRATIFTSNAVYKYARFFSSSQRQSFILVSEQPVDGWWPIQDTGDPSWPLPWVDSKGAPLGLAVVPFISPRGSLVASIIGLNNALNKTNLDLLANADQQGFGLIAIKYDKLPPATTSSGSEIDPAGDGLGLRPGRALETTGEVTKLPADDMKGLLDFAQHLTVSIASNSDIPMHEFVPIAAQIPSGAALQMLDAALAGQADECCTWFTSSWRTVMELGQRLGYIYGGYQGEPQTVTPVWAPTAYVDSTSEQQARTAEATEIKALVESGMPLEIALRRRGWSDGEIAELQQAREAEQAAAQTSLASALLEQQRRFDQNGNQPNGGQ